MVTDWSRRKTLEPAFGDRIEMSRWFGLYNHWALYIGNDIVVNFINVDNPSSKKKADKVKVQQSKLKDTIGRSKWRINNSDDVYLFQPATRADVTRRIQKFKDIWSDYNLKANNCKHFVNYCRYGEKYSLQAISNFTRTRLAFVLIFCILFFYIILWV